MLGYRCIQTRVSKKTKRDIITYLMITYVNYSHGGDEAMVSLDVTTTKQWSSAVLKNGIK